MEFIFSLIVFILILGTLVLIHEFGHFIVAKWCGVYVEEFGFGFPPRVWGKKIGETLYSLNLLPIGGFVKVYGEEYEETLQKTYDKKLKDRTFVYKAPYQKAAIVVAGVIMNIILGVCIYYALLASNGFKSEVLPLFENASFAFGRAETHVVVGGIVKDSPAAKAGITTEEMVRSFAKPGRELVPIKNADELISVIKMSENQKIRINLQNIKTGVSKQVELVPLMNKDVGRPVIGVNLVDAVIINYDTNAVDRIFSGFMHAYNLSVYNFQTLGHLIAQSVSDRSTKAISSSVAGPVGIFLITSDLIKTSGDRALYNILSLAALMSLSLAVMNILPFPALDGGRLVFIIYEWITKRRVNATFERYLNTAGFALLLVLILFITINDILRLIK